MAVDYELDQSVARIYLNRPHRLNAVVPELTAGLVTALGRAGQDGARVVILAGRGRAFCSGFAAENAEFGFPEVSVGLSVTGGISRLLPLLVGPVRAKELLLLGDRFGAPRALELGLVNRVAPAGQHEQVAAGIAARLRDQPALALALAKQALDRGAECALEEAMAAETDFAALTVAPGATSAPSGTVRSDAG